jgi:guanine deaminase
MITVRLARPSDMAAICGIVDHFIAKTTINFRTTPQPRKEWLAEWTRSHARYPWLVATQGDAVVGVAYAGPWKAREAYDWSAEVTVYVAHDAVRRGIGRALYVELLARLDAQGYRTAVAVIGLPNPASVGLHEALGFRHAGTLREIGYKHGGWHDVGLWQRSGSSMALYGTPTPVRGTSTMAAANSEISSRPTKLRGRLLAPHPTERRLEHHADAVVEIDAAGIITSVAPAGGECSIPETWPGAVILPGFVDAHVHYPQTRIIGSASGPLLQWLQASVFPEESRFADPEHAAVVAEEFCAALLAQGTTSAAVYSSSHLGATELLLRALDRHGLRAVTGLALMDRGAPAAVLRGFEAARTACDELYTRWHGRDGGRLRISAIPRFALSCTPTLLREAAAFADAHGLLVQTHISENLDEVAATRVAFPGSRDYLGVYEDHGLVGPRTILAHCIHLSADEWERLRAQDVAVAHCPDSNFFLGSGQMPLRRALDLGVRVGLGTDVGAGRTFSLRRVAAAAHDAALVRGEPVASQELLWLATRGGAQVLGQADRLGCVAPGFCADLVAVDVPPGVGGGDTLVDALLFRHDAGPVRAVMVGGRRCGGADR